MADLTSVAEIQPIREEKKPEPPKPPTEVFSMFKMGKKSSSKTETATDSPSTTSSYFQSNMTQPDSKPLFCSTQKHLNKNSKPFEIDASQIGSPNVLKSQKSGKYSTSTQINETQASKSKTLLSETFDSPINGSSKKKRSRNVDENRSGSTLTQSSDLTQFKLDKSNKKFKKPSFNATTEWICINDGNDHQNFVLIDSDEEDTVATEKKSSHSNNSSVCSLDFDDEFEADFAAIKNNKKKRKNVANQSLEFVKDEPLSQDLGVKTEIEPVDSTENETIKPLSNDQHRCSNYQQSIFESSAEYEEFEREFKKSIPKEARSYMKKNKFKRLLVIDLPPEHLGLRIYRCEKGNEGAALSQNCFIDETSGNCWQYLECVNCSKIVALTLRFSDDAESAFVCKYRNKILLFAESES
jgi:hypothetical protein